MTLEEFKVFEKGIQQEYKDRLLSNQELFECVDDPKRLNVNNYHMQQLQIKHHYSDDLTDCSPEEILEVTRNFLDAVEDIRPTAIGLSYQYEPEVEVDDDGYGYISSNNMVCSYYVLGSYNPSHEEGQINRAFSEYICNLVKARFRRSIRPPTLQLYRAGKLSFAEVVKDTYPNV